MLQSRNDSADSAVHYFRGGGWVWRGGYITDTGYTRHGRGRLEDRPAFFHADAATDQGTGNRGDG